ncbi:MAG: pyridoxamine 5'-phosphate oxidase [Bacteroidales bacterium]|jgi:pyridoxamine 5'-phosphate oxidase|nr:pyridoxamine 5'-phosphate oxidase [Bacteroidales bacterium]
MNSVRRATSLLRNEYHGTGINPGDFAEDPILQFERWMEDAITNNVKEPNAVHLATADAEGRPSGRIVLLRDFSMKGFSFFTNYSSRKGEELEQNNHAAMTFFWNELYRQVRIGGKVYRLPAEESDAYFRSRPRQSQISAFVSQQSRELENRELLERMAAEAEEKYRDNPVPRPENWGGYYLVPEYVEFWQGREQRLHDRVRYQRRDGDSVWTMTLLYP